MSLFVKAVPRGALALSFVVFLVVSVAASTTGLLLYSSSSALLSPLGGGGGVAVIYSNSTRAPETGSVPASIAVNASGAAGVRAVLPEVLSIVSVDGSVAFVRGTDVPAFVQLEHATLASGAWPGSNGSLAAGEWIASRLGLRAGENVTLFSLQTNRSFSFVVSGVFSSPHPYDYELVTTTGEARAMAGLRADRLTIVRLFVDSSFNGASLYRYLTPKGGGHGGGQPLPNLNLLPVGAVSGSGSTIVDQLLVRTVGLSLDLLWAIVVVVVSASLLMLYFGISLLVGECYQTVSTFISLGMSKRRAASLLSALTALSGVSAGAAGYFVSYLLLSAGVASPEVLFQPLSVQPELGVLALSASFPAAVTLLFLPAAFWKRFGELL
jgi:hypothetical protein